MTGAAEQFLTRYAFECQLEPDLHDLASLMGDGGSLSLVTVMTILPTVLAQLQAPVRRAELLHALGRAYVRATAEETAA